jgi:hypothetical protein
LRSASDGDAEAVGEEALAVVSGTLGVLPRPGAPDGALRSTAQLCRIFRTTPLSPKPWLCERSPTGLKTGPAIACAVHQRSVCPRGGRRSDWMMWLLWSIQAQRAERAPARAVWLRALVTAALRAGPQIAPAGAAAARRIRVTADGSGKE